jgi:hypothetical protein
MGVGGATAIYPQGYNIIWVRKMKHIDNLDD